MKHIFAYELVAFTFLLIILLNYYFKSWIPIRRNRIFQFLLFFTVFMTGSDLALKYSLEHTSSRNAVLEHVSIVVVCCGIVLLLMLQYAYYLALVEKMDYRHNKKIVASFVPGTALIVVLIISNIIDIPYFRSFQFNTTNQFFNNLFGSIVILAYLVASIIIILRNITYIGKMQTVIVLFYNIFLLCMVYAQNKTKGEYMVSFYGAVALLIVLYVVIQKVDIHTDHASGCFRDVGFNLVLKEAENYEESFSILNINIINYRNLVNMCTTEEVDEIQKKIGMLLRNISGKRNVFHMHGSEYVVIRKNKMDIQNIFEICLDVLPKTIRMNGRDIIIHYGFFCVSFADASYSVEEFIRLRGSMRHEVFRIADGNKLFFFEGSMKEKIIKKMYVSHLLKEMQETEEVPFMYHGIIDNQTQKFSEIEIAPYINENGYEIINEELWEAAMETGCIKSFGRLVFENAMRQVKELELLEHGIEKIHINLLPVQMNSVDLISNYLGCAIKYGIPCNKICIEISEQLEVSGKSMEECMGLLKKQGIMLLLDRYGYDACNLQDTMSMPFDKVKISYNMIHSYCREESKVLEYQVKMLRSRGWKIGFDGIDKKEYWEKVSALQPDFKQGYYFPVFHSEEELKKYLQGREAELYD